LLLDRWRKRIPAWQDIFYQVVRQGHHERRRRPGFDFKDTIILMTPTKDPDLIKSLCSDPDTRPDPDGFPRSAVPRMLKRFKPAFLGRLAVVPYYPLSDE